MCQPEALERVKPLQFRNKPLYCTGSTVCWCAKVSYVLPTPSITSECMSPTELLKVGGDNLSTKDRSYLISISHREFLH